MKKKSIKINENLAFAFYYAEENEAQVYVFENGVAEGILWADAPSNFNPYYRGQLGDKYYFYSVFGDEGFLYEYDHSTNSTRKISLPYVYHNIRLFTDKLNGKIYLYCSKSINDEEILSFDGNDFEVFDSPSGYSIFRDEFLFSEPLNEILIWYEELGNTNNGAKLYTFDGSTLTSIPNPSNDLIPGAYGVPFGNNVILPYVNRLNNTDQIFSLYKYEGSNLVEIPGLPNEEFYDIQIFNKENKLYIGLYNNLTSVLYQYDGNSISEISTPPFYYPQFLTEYDGKDMFSFFDNDLNYARLYSYDGASFEEITAPQYEGYIYFGGILNDKLYLGYYNSTNETSNLLSYIAGDAEVQTVINVPETNSYSVFYRKPNENYLIQAFKENDDYALYAQNANEQFQKLDPEDHLFDRIEFQLGDKTYISYYDSEYVSQIFVWDGTLTTPDFNSVKNDIIIFPNPFTKDISIGIPNELNSQSLEISLFSIDGKIIKKQSLEDKSSQIQLSLETLISGIYILEVKGETTIIRKKIIKK